jgi:PAS domain S-box-containing protein
MATIPQDKDFAPCHQVGRQAARISGTGASPGPAPAFACGSKANYPFAGNSAPNGDGEKAPDRRQVLLIEDNPGDARLIREMLHEGDPDHFQLAHVDRLSAGLDRLAAGDLDLVLLDLNLPDSQGLDTLARVQAAAPGAAIVVLTGLDDDALALKAIQQGAQDYLPKGQLDRRLLLRALRYALERKDAAEELELKERLLDGASDSIFLHDQDGHFIYVNEAAYKTRGYGKEELLAQDLAVLPTPEYAQLRPELLSELLAKGETVFDSAHFRKDGSVMPVEVHARTIDLNGRRLILSVARDITARKLAEERLLSAAKKWRTSFDAISDAMCLLDRECVIQQCNQAMAELVGKPFSEIIGRHCWELVHGTAGPIAGCPLGRMKQSRHRETLTLPFGDRWLHVIVDPILDEAGEVAGAVHIIADITANRAAEVKIRNLNSLLLVIKQINEALLRAQTESELYQQICDLLVQTRDVKFVWIGLTETDNFEVKPAAWAGDEAGYLSGVKVTWDDSPCGLGPTGQGIKTGWPFVRRSIATDADDNPWRAAALERGYRASLALPLVHGSEVIGAINIYSGKEDAFQDEEIGFFHQVAGDIALGVKSLRLERTVENSLQQLQTMLEQTIEAIAVMAEMRDPYTAGHQRRSTQLACAIGAEMGLDEDRLAGLRVAGFLHDVGKISLPAEILSKPGGLKENEIKIIQTHPEAGFDILKAITFPWPVAQIVLQHHERLNGAGYPQGLRGQDILLEARILAVADVVEAMASHRPYRPALGIDQALEEIAQHKGILYDPEVAAACIKLFTEKGFRFEAQDLHHS